MAGAEFATGKLPADVLARLISHSASASDPRLLVGPGVGEDAAVIDMGDRCLVAATDPITFATDRIGWYAVHINANDIAAMGATPRWFLSTIIVPQELATESLFEQIFEQIHQACGDMGIAVAGGHTEISYGMDRPIVVGQMLGEAPREQIVRSSGLQVGDDLLLTKGVAIEATALIAQEKRQDLLDAGWSAQRLDRCANYLTDPGISVVAEARIACESGEVHAMHDPTEGGVATALREVADASAVGLDVFAAALQPTTDTADLCAAFDLQPLGAISSGALLIGCAPHTTGQILRGLSDAGIAAQRVGVARERQHGLVLLKDDGSRYDLPAFAVDEIARLFAETEP